MAEHVTARDATNPDQACVFCDIAAGRAEASVVYEDDTVVAFMDTSPVTRGHLLVVPRAHAGGFEDLGDLDGARVWSTGRDLARALRRSSLRCDGINMLVCDGIAAYQTVFHFHLHVIPRYTEDGWMQLTAVPPEQERSRLDVDAREIRSAIAQSR
jgi:histidine triad (HIT) family protein